MSETTEAAPSSTIQAEVERLRALAPDTKALYREVAAALFFRFGVPPTANRLFQLVGKGSMATAASVLARFWQDLREHSRLRLEHPGVPEPLRDAAGSLIGQVWTAAYDLAQQDLAGARAELQAQLEQVRNEAERARLTATEAEGKLAERNRAVEQLQREVADGDGLLSARDGEISRLQVEVAALKSSIADRRAEVDEAKRAFAGELESLRSAIALTEERARASERRALAEIEAARHKADDAGKALAKQQKIHASEIDRFGKSLAKREAEIDVMRERLARAESALSHCAGQLKSEQLKFNRLLARVQPENHRTPKGMRLDPTPRLARKGGKGSAQR